MTIKNKKQIVIAVGRALDAKPDVIVVLRCAESVKKAVSGIGWSVSTLYISKHHKNDNFKEMMDELFILSPDCVFNLFEGFGDDPQAEYEFAKAMEEKNIIFTGNSSKSLLTCLDKKKTNDMLSARGIAVPKGIMINRVEDIYNIKLSFPVFIKPCFRDSSDGIDAESLVFKPSNLERVIKKKIKAISDGLILEEFIPGNEYNISYICGKEEEMMGISVMEYHKYPELTPFIDYQAKWDARSESYKKLTPEVIPLTSLDAILKKEVNELCRDISKLFGCRGYFRVDVREKNGTLYVLDVNPNPDINEDSGFMRQAYSRGYQYHEVIKMIIKNAIQHAEENEQIKQH
ncbi:MAG: ATP-grasp domain-containing protein [Candidatus Omnitrophica bacterium]|nr:ATP-grasp domain-containing protein [Candidatus Omnitrophota bacterium]